MIFHENRLLADDSHVISCLIFSKIRQNLSSAAVVIGALRVVLVFHTLCIPVAKALVRLHILPNTSEHLLLADKINTKISCAGPFFADNTKKKNGFCR